MVCFKTKYVMLSVIGFVTFIPLVFIALFFISTMDMDDLFTPSENYQISKWKKWCEEDISQFTSIAEITKFLKEREFHQIIRPAYTRSERRFYDIYQYEGYEGYGGKIHYINDYENEKHVYIKITDRNVRNWKMGHLIDKTLLVTIGYKEGTLIQCKPIVIRHGR